MTQKSLSSSCPRNYQQKGISQKLTDSFFGIEVILRHADDNIQIYKVEFMMI